MEDHFERVQYEYKIMHVSIEHVLIYVTVEQRITGQGQTNNRVIEIICILLRGDFNFDFALLLTYNILSILRNTILKKKILEFCDVIINIIIH